MKITVDLRSLSSGTISGVENYCLNLLGNLFAIDKQNQYVLFYNAMRPKQLPDFHYVNSQVKYTRYPSKLLNLALKFQMTTLESLAGPSDWLFMPNLNQFHISPKIKLAITVHDLSPVVTPEFYNFRRQVWHKFLNYKWAFNRADVLFAVSDYTKKDLIKIFNIAPEKIKVIFPGIDHSIFNPAIPQDDLRQARNLHNLPGEYILFLNTVEPRKNLAGVIRAFEKINSPAYLLIAGRLGWKYSKDFNLIRKSKKSAKIRYIGYLEEKCKPAIIKLAKGLIYPSFYEGFGFQPLEAMALGTPVIGSSVTALPEVVGSGGLLVNPYDENQLAESLQAVLTNEVLRSQLIEKGLAQSQKFSWRTAAEQVLQNLR